ncbi:MAG: cyanophycinase [Alcanivoracaceae bacterium]|nr:cyanophycinase [Alcanivoracaceae bacterium]
MCPAGSIENRDRGWIIPIGGAEDKENDMKILDRFCQLSGGKDAKILIIPTASELEDTGPRYVEIFEKLGATAMYIKVDEREDCFKERIQGKLKRATGIFITGGNQLRLSTILGGTPVAKLIRSLNAHGVHVAGTSAGAAIVSEHMIAGGRPGPTPKEDGATMAPGLGLTNKIIIDQHFRQRDRIGRLMAALSYNPFVSGIGIDEDTAAFISPDGILEVVGAGAITVIDPADLTHSSMHDARHQDSITLIGMKLHILGEGCKYDINSREAFA